MYAKNAINPETITYVEAHGTGTKLGDPIEIEALTEAFRCYTQKKQYCAIGSLKTNIGHTSAAAGVGSVIKTLLCLQHHKLVPSLNYVEANEHINFQDSPFYVNTQVTDWRPNTDEPLRAAISAFGFSGTNCHMVIEECPMQMSKEANKKSYYLITLSALDEMALQRRISDLHEWLAAHMISASLPILENISYTLNAGRSHFEKRCAIVVNSIEGLHDTLRQLCTDHVLDNVITQKNDAEKISNEALTQLLSETEHYTEKSPVSYRQILLTLGRAYVQGHELNWQVLHVDEMKQRVPLPTYSFAREHCWLPFTSERTAKNNTSSFSYVLTGQEFYLREHHVNAAAVLPAAASLGLIRTASKDDSYPFILHNVVWKSPIIMQKNPITITVTFTPQENAATRFIIETKDKNETFVHTQGDFMASSQSVFSTQPVLNIDDIENKCHEKISAEKIYTEFANRGLHYGKTFRVLQWLALINANEVFAFLKLPAETMDASFAFDLPSNLLDGAFQALLGFFRTPSKTTTLLPWQMGSMMVYERIPEQCYVYVERESSIDKGPPAFHIQLLDTQGKVIIQIRHFQVYEMTPSKIDIYYAESVWQEKMISKFLPSQYNARPPALLIGDDEQLIKALQTKYHTQNSIVFSTKNVTNESSIQKFIYSLAEQKKLPQIIIYCHTFSQTTDIKTHYIDQWQLNFVTLFHIVRALLLPQSVEEIRLICVNRQPNLQALSFLSANFGFLKTLHAEQPRMMGKVIEVISEDNLETTVDNILQELTTSDAIVRYKEGVRLVKQFVLMDTNEKEHAPISLRKAGVYLIAGGTGGLGLLFARYLAKNFQARLVLLGRSPISESKKIILNELMADKADVLYLSVDITDPKAVSEAIKTAKLRFGEINGIIQSAGVLQDAFILKKELNTSTNVLASKINGTINLDEATKTEPLDFFVVFSSLASILGNIGQCDYAYANGCLDDLMLERERQRIIGKRNGKSIAINWPYWYEGGMKIDTSTLQWMEKSLNVNLLDTNEGIAGFLTALNLPATQIAVLKSNQKNVISLLNSALMTKTITAFPNTEIKTNQNNNYKQVETYLKEQLAPIMKLSPSRLRSQVPFEKYGINSIMILEVMRHLEQEFGPLSKTLFFEYQTLEDLTKYFIKYHTATLANKLSLAQVEPEIQTTLSTSPLQASETKDIAIIGISGRYPDAETLDKFWENLCSGTDSITEIPAERWDYKLYFDQNRGQPGKIYSKWGGFIKDVDQFDPLFFDISPREAEQMDPQERLFLENAWQVLENAGYTPKKLSREIVGVFVGAMHAQYQFFGMEACKHGQAITANSSFASIANRVSYAFNFHGPSVAVDTMCSSSLMAIHLACNSIREGECSVAIAGGVNLNLHPQQYVILSQEKFLSSDGYCRSFGEGGDGYVPGEGVGAVLLKSLSDALQDGDYIYGVIKGSNVNHGGKTNGYTVPNPNAQFELIETAWQKANIDPQTISYIEAHGTGTALGDPIEITGLSRAFSAAGDKYKCPIGSVKSNIGHLEGAAGIAALTKVLLQLQHKTLVPSLHAETLNQYINFAETPFYVQRELTEWKQPIAKHGHIDKEEPRRAAISSFGAGGTNVHMIIEEAPMMKPGENTVTKPYYLILLSAKTKVALQQRLLDLENWLIEADLDRNNLLDISYTLNTRRVHFDKRCAMVVSSITQLKETLKHIQLGNKQDNYFIRYEELEDNQSEDKLSDTAKEILQSLEQQEVSAPIYREKLLTLAENYVAESDIDFEQMYQHSGAQKTILPYYPFTKKRYWYDKSTIVKKEQSTTLSSTLSNVSQADTTKITLKAPGTQPMQTEKLPLPQIAVSFTETNLSPQSQSQVVKTQQPMNYVSERIEKILQELLCLSTNEISQHKTFQEYGMDSIRSVEFIHKINYVFNLNIPAATLFEFPTLSLLAKHIDSFLTTSSANENKIAPPKVDELAINNVKKIALKTQNNIEPQKLSPVTLGPDKLMVSTQETYVPNDIAIIGVSFEFAGAKNSAEFWKNLSTGHSAIIKIPKERWSIEEFYDQDPQKPDKSYCQFGGFIDDIDQFDPLFFGISPLEAEWMDPQQRLMLQNAWHTVEDAGYSASVLENTRCGVYVGVINQDYAELVTRQYGAEKNPQMATGISNSILGSRISYFLNLKGPAITVDTACSSSLVAIHLACQALRTREIDIALAGGVTLYLSETPYVSMSRTGMLSPDGQCKTFDNKANGIVPGEGVGVIMLKRLEDALKDRDQIYAVIKGSGINQDGKTNGITAPNMGAQRELEIEIYRTYHINPEMITYVEAHGTGTKLGDPVEVAALTGSFKRVY